MSDDSSTYQLIGAVYSEYASAYNANSGRLHVFTHQLDTFDARMDAFTALCSRVICNNGLPNDLSLETATINDRTQTSVWSASIVGHLEGLGAPQLIEHLCADGTAAQKLAFLTGAHIVHGLNKAPWVFYNNRNKALWTHRMLLDMANEGDEICLTSKLATPHCHIITLNANGPLWASLIKALGSSS